MFTESTPLTIDNKFPIMESKYILEIKNLYMDEYAIRINYKVTPPVPYMSPETGNALLFTWRGYAKDNSGNEYHSCGGACGLSSDGKFTDGVLSFTPLFDEKTVSLDITMITERLIPEYKYNFKVTFE
jgi:hypothetical protein